ncbi:hypothetical protein OE88DRAFT_1641109 [Heliocybe sulcata]|uniref:Uncharacterized protein n=1 Tax=Heliocybe sulcata TaxID=5364 RepID=A0A5C3NMQ5_9AGAM|nr:hypothetical protein OE88DRAFT_1641109 [Heliocybe sulcata]
MFMIEGSSNYAGGEKTLQSSRSGGREWTRRVLAVSPVQLTRSGTATESKAPDEPYIEPTWSATTMEEGIHPASGNKHLCAYHKLLGTGIKSASGPWVICDAPGILDSRRQVEFIAGKDYSVHGIDTDPVSVPQAGLCCSGITVVRDANEVRDDDNYPQRDTAAFYDLVIGSRLAALALVWRILEFRPAALYTEDDLLRLRSLRRRCYATPTTLENERRGPSAEKRRGTCPGRMHILVVDRLDDPSVQQGMPKNHEGRMSWRTNMGRALNSTKENCFAPYVIGLVGVFLRGSVPTSRALCDSPCWNFLDVMDHTVAPRCNFTLATRILEQKCSQPGSNWRSPDFPRSRGHYYETGALTN